MLRIRRDRRPNPGVHRQSLSQRISRDRERGGASEEGLEPCFVPGCDELIGADETILRFQIGRVIYTDRGDVFRAEPLEGRRDSAYSHLSCASAARIVDFSRKQLLDLELGWCRKCNLQFYCEVEPKEMVINVQKGFITESKKTFVTKFTPDYEGGCLHWGCALDHWDELTVRRLVPWLEPLESLEP